MKTYEYEDTYGRMSTFNGNALEFDKRGRLKTCGEIEFTYDNYGNCTKKQNYHTGTIFNYAWTRGRLLDSVNATTYTYNKDGIRTRKVIVDGYNIIAHEYFYDGNKLIAEKVGDDYFYFFYDESGVCGFRYKDINYEYVKNIFGDIIGIYNEYGTHVATYAYDAWGNMIYCNAGTDVALINPFLYRGYYFDSESGLYYLMSRYYDPQIGRFISMDTPDYLAPETIGGVDLYAYGLNNPVMYVDPTGHAWETVFDIGFAIWSLVDFIKDPTWANAGWLALDILALAVPFLPGGSKVITKADDIVDAVGFVNKYDEVIVLGQSMGKRVIPYADEIGATFYKGLDNFNDLENSIGTVKASLIGYFDNMGYIAQHTFNGAKFIDKGFDASRTLKGLKGMDLFREVMSRVTIHSEKFLAPLLRKKNVFRFFRHWLF